MWLAPRRASGIAVIVALGALLGIAPAQAAPGVGEVEVSDDGITFAKSLNGVLFDEIDRYSPGDSESNTIYVRNTGSAAGFLRITLRDVSYSDLAFADALTVTTTVDGGSGSATAISSANPCAVTNEGAVVAPGETVAVRATLALGDLNGSAGQGATASASLRFTLSDTTPGTLPATNCDTTGTTVPVTPTSPGSPTATDSGEAVLTGSPGSAANNPTPSPTITAAPEEASGPSLLPSLSSTFALDPNTWRLYQEYLVLILVLAAIVGAGISWLFGRRSRKDTNNV